MAKTTRTSVRTPEMVKKLIRCVCRVTAHTLSCAHTGVLLYRGYKRKRSMPPSSPVQSAIEMDDAIINNTLPQIQGQTTQYNRQQTPSARSDSPASPRHSPSSPVTMPNVEDEATKHNKPPNSKLTTQALRTAKSEVRQFSSST